MPAKKTGTEAQLYRNTATFGSIAPSPCKIGSLHFIDKPSNSFNSSDRVVLVDTVIPTRSMWSVEGDFLWDSTDANLVAMVNAAQSGSAIDMIVTDGAIATTGTKGFHAWWAVESGWDNEAQLTEGQKCKFKLVPHGNGANDPVRITI